MTVTPHVSLLQIRGLLHLLRWLVLRRQQPLRVEPPLPPLAHDAFTIRKMEFPAVFFFRDIKEHWVACEDSIA